MDRLLTKKELAERWQVNPKSIDNWVKEGKISCCEKVPGDIRFNPEYIAMLEGTEFNPLSPLERRRLEKELERITRERDMLKSTIAEINLAMTKAIYKKTDVV